MKKIMVIGTAENLEKVKHNFEGVETDFVVYSDGNKAEEVVTKDLTNLVVYLNAGHGDFANGQNQTFKSDGKEYHFTEGNNIVFSAYEGQTNRIFANKIKNELEKRGAEVVLTHLPILDLHNFQRIQIANTHFQKANKAKKFIWFSLHSNALSLANSGPGTTANGIEVFTSNNASQNSVSFANQFMVSLRPIFDKYKVANRGHKKAEFTELVGTQMPAILIENLFFDNLREAKLLINETYQDDFCEACMSCFTWYSKQN